MFITKNALLFCVFLLSRSSRSAWIEISLSRGQTAPVRCRAPRGARGLKLQGSQNGGFECGRAPRGARGLKSCTSKMSGESHPVALLAERVD